MSLRVLGASVLLVGALAAPAQATTEQRYVALGDSYTAGPGIPNQHGEPFGCKRSDHNYPSVVARALKPAKFVDVSCSGAVTKNMTEAQTVPFGTSPPQFNVLTKNTTLVTIGIGANDIGFEVLLNCVLLSFTDPHGAPCKKYYGHQVDKKVAATAPRIAAVIKGVHKRSPRARVVLVGYLRFLPERKGCWPAVPVAAGDVPFLNHVQRSLDAVIAAQARAHGASFVNVRRASRGHDMCAPPGTRWIEGPIPASPADPVHPNAAGMHAVGKLVLDVISRRAS